MHHQRLMAYANVQCCTWYTCFLPALPHATPLSAHQTDSGGYCGGGMLTAPATVEVSGMVCDSVFAQNVWCVCVA